MPSSQQLRSSPWRRNNIGVSRAFRTITSTLSPTKLGGGTRGSNFRSRETAKSTTPKASSNSQRGDVVRIGHFGYKPHEIDELVSFDQSRYHTLTPAPRAGRPSHIDASPVDERASQTGVSSTSEPNFRADASSNGKLCRELPQHQGHKDG